jgi:hypothetical protein
MLSVKCLHCDADNDPRQTGGYCDSCGKKLPPASGFRSRRSERPDSIEETLSESVRPRRQTAEAIVTAAVLALVGGGMFLVLGPVFLSRVPEEFAPAIMLLTVLGMVWNGMLGVWARVQPQPAAITALVSFAIAWLAIIVVVVALPDFVGMPRGAALLTLVEAPVLGYLIKAVAISGRDRAS